MIKIILFLLSLLCYSLSFVFSKYLGWLIPVSFFLIFKYMSEYRPGFFSGLLWGIIFYSIYFFNLFDLINLCCFGKYRLLAWFFWILYCSLFTGLWFLLYKKFPAWSLVAFLYFYFLDNFLLIIFFKPEGFRPLSPLVPLMEFGVPKMLVCFLGMNLALFFWLCLAVVTNRYILRQAQYERLVLLFGVIIFLENFLVFEKPKPISQIVCSAVPFKKDRSATIKETSENICKVLEKINLKYPVAKCIIFPESTFPFNLNEYPEIVACWFTIFRGKIILGGHRSQKGRPATYFDGLSMSGLRFISRPLTQSEALAESKGVAASDTWCEKIFNTCYLCNNGYITSCYDKQSGLPFAEVLPKVWSKFECSKFFLDKQREFDFFLKSKKIFEIEDLKLEPHICSELFFSPKIKSDFNICLVNDAWYGDTYFSRLLFLSAVLTGCGSRAKIIYVSHFYAFFIDDFGNVCEFPKVCF